jgi:hypothetical protein
VPQFALSVPVSVHVPLQKVWPVVQPHVPPVQDSPPMHA